MKLWVPIAIGTGVALLYTARKASAAAGMQGPHSRSVRAVPGLDIRGNARRTPEGYILSGRFAAEHVPAIADAGIKVILGAVDPGEEAKAAAERHGIEWVGIPLHTNWRHGEVIRYYADAYPPSQIMIHCQYGVDRTGNIIAHLLTTKHGWPVDDALFAVVYPHPEQIAALAEILYDYGYPERSHPTGTYSLAPIGKAGGMKAAHSGYERLIRTNLDELQQLGVA